MNMDDENAKKLAKIKEMVQDYNKKLQWMKLDFETMSIDEICTYISATHTLNGSLDNIRRGLLDVRRK